MGMHALRGLFVICITLIGCVIEVGCGHRDGELPSKLRSLAASATSTIIGDQPLDQNPNITIGTPLVGATSEILISRKQYLISWNKVHRQPNYVVWHLANDDLGNVGRQNNFATDPDLERYLVSHYQQHAVKPTDYQGSCFDRGHQVPSADRTASREDNSKTFMMSNMIPQTAFLNRGPWEHLENHERSLMNKTDQTIYIIAGPVFAESPAHIGPAGDIDVPTQNFKIIVQLSGADGAGKLQVLTAVLMPNQTSAGTDPVSDHKQACDDSVGNRQATNSLSSANDWERYSVSVDEIAQASGFDFSFLQ